MVTKSPPRKQVSVPAPDPIPLGGNRYRVPSASQPHVSYIVDLDAGDAGTCGCPHFIHRQTPCKHIRAALRAARTAASSESVDSPAQKPATPQAPRGSHSDAVTPAPNPITHGTCRDCGAHGALLDGVCLFGLCYPDAAYAARRRR